MGQIARLSEQAINQIAAGEVIENPASVVKELVENSLDAGATEIAVEIQGGGRRLIRVSDNGSGMERDDALLALERHATSKLRSAEELFSLQSMGFRGEALPSIASISEILLITAPEVGEGTLIAAKGGEIASYVTAARDKGTTFEVRELFFNVPVRKKFQRSPSYDAQEIERLLLSLALAHEKIGFSLLSDGKKIFDFAPSTATALEAFGERVKQFIGEALYSSLRPLEGNWGDITLFGFIGLPHLHRQNKSGQQLIVNRRCIAAPSLSYAIKESYGSLLPPQRHPLFILHLSLPPEKVDVNVHPQKREVRFLREENIRNSLREAIGETLHGKNTSVTPFEEELFLSPLPTMEVPSFPKTSEPFFLPVESTTPPPSSLSLQLTAPLLPTLIGISGGYLLLDPSAAGSSPLLAAVPPLPPALFLVDQQRAEQRILYERLCEGRKEPREEELFLIPLTLDLSSEESALLTDHTTLLRSLGIDCRCIGPTSWAIDAVPAVLSKAFPALLEELLSLLRSATRSKEELQELLAKRLCKASAVRKTATLLSQREAHALLTALMACRQPLFCPFGLPIATCLSADQLKRFFS